MKLGLRGKILLPALSVVAVVTAITTALNYKLNHDTIESNVREEVSMVAELVAHELEVWLDDRVGDVRGWASIHEYVPAVTEGDEAAAGEFREVAERVVEERDVYLSINLINAEGDYVATSDRGSEGISVKDRGYFRRAMAGETVISEVITDRATGKPAFVVAAPVREDGEIVGVVSGVVDLEQFSEVNVESIKLFDSGYVYIVESNGRVIAHPNHEHVLKMNYRSKFDWGEELLTTKKGYLIYELDGLEKMAGVAHVKATGWIVGATAPLDELLAGASRLGNINIALGVGSLVSIALIVTFILRRTLRPLDEGVAFSRRIAAGDLTADMPVRSDDEIGQLAQAMNTMARGLRDAIGRIA